jgi:hypothetical protein
MVSAWVMRLLLALVLVVIASNYVRACYAQPRVVHTHFDLGQRREAVATRLKMMGARLCCPEGQCAHATALLDSYVGMLRVTTRKRTPHCGDGEALLLNDRRLPLPVKLHGLEKLLTRGS